jgi:CheY-like chemotaxis protein
MIDILRKSWTSPTAKIMVASDDSQIVAVWAYAREQNRLQTSLASLGEEALERWNVDLPDLVVVDSHGWQMEEIEFCCRLLVEPGYHHLSYGSGCPGCAGEAT